MLIIHSSEVKNPTIKMYHSKKGHAKNPKNDTHSSGIHRTKQLMEEPQNNTIAPSPVLDFVSMTH